jgi:class 3 adenylate cyclase
MNAVEVILQKITNGGQFASWIRGRSAPGQVLVSETVRSLARTSAGVRFKDRGEQSLKGVGEPVRVWAVCTSSLLPRMGEGRG